MFMSNLRTFLLLFIFALLISACGEENQNSETDSTDTESAEVNVEKGAPIICMWSAVSIKETPAQKGKYITAIYLGEKASYLGETAIDSSNAKKPVEFVKVKLTDGTTGWVQANFMAIDAQSYAVKETTKLYKRPDILSAGKDEFEIMQFVVVTEEQDDWAKIKGKRRTDGWFKEGWVKKDRLTNNEIDITVAILAERAMSKGDKEKKLEALNDILENPDLSSSAFSGDVRALVEKLTMPNEDEAVEEEVSEDYGD